MNLRALWISLLAATSTVACNSTNGEEPAGSDTGVDAGGAVADAATTPPVQACTKNADCDSKICNTALSTCLAPTPTDGAQNADETDIDCGGAGAKACDVAKKCKVASDCTSGVCIETCQAPTSTDGVRNGNETGIDCGGTGNPRCGDGLACATRDDCTSSVCTAGTCTKPTTADNVKNGTETDVDCGGEGNPPCADLKTCAIAADCTSLVCTTTVCQVPTTSDLVKNGTETDVDCGGTSGKTCAATKVCLVDGDCSSGGCDYNKKCADRRSCTVHYGGDTCGFGGEGVTGPADYESCCATANVTTTVSGQPTTTALGKYQVTAGRMRKFLTSVNGNVRGFIATARGQNRIPVMPGTTSSLMPSSWDMYLPTSMEGDDAETRDCDQGGYNTGTGQCNAGTTYAPMYTSANNHVGPTIFKANSQPDQQGCSYSSPGVHMYYLGARDYAGDTAEYTQDVYDQKPMQCMDWLIAQAFCIWDGGRLETMAEWAAAWGTATAMPWGATPTPKNQGFNTYAGCRFPSTTNDLLRAGACDAGLRPSATQSIEHANYMGSYEWPVLKDDGNDYSAYIAPPGRHRGRSAAGHADIVGNLLEMTSNLSSYTASPFSARSSWAANGSWEVHGYNRGAAYGTYTVMSKYGKQGMRCAYPQ